MSSIEIVTNAEREKIARPRPEENAEDAGTSEDSSPMAAAPSKKRRKLNDGSATKTEKPSSGFLAAVSNFLSGSWFWPSSMPETKIADLSSTEEKEPATNENGEKADELSEADGEQIKNDKEENADADRKSDESTKADDADSKDDNEKDKGDDNDEEEKTATPTAADIKDTSKKIGNEGNNTKCSKNLANKVEKKSSSLSPKETSPKKKRSKKKKN
ncbi:unnamed protein product [Pseudo-nitzschia multistriata]|uniref:Uncharacterized protein n=1 Tax=Pseudo-nitzschia multistriata TaxID=183589 RepID=A0A448ZJQ9_9STRA|nr:unnamed protein product [Pseudo-nitzschia multistriata]